MTSDATIVKRYVHALQEEAKAVRDLTDVMRKQPVPDDEYQELDKKYKAAVEERKEALLALWERRHEQVEG